MRSGKTNHPQRVVKVEPWRIVLKLPVGLAIDGFSRFPVGCPATGVEQIFDGLVVKTEPPRSCDTSVNLFRQHAKGAQRARIEDAHVTDLLQSDTVSIGFTVIVDVYF